MTKKTIKKVVTIFTAGSIVLSTPFIAHKFISEHQFNFDEVSKVADAMVNKASYSRIAEKPVLKEVELLETKEENTDNISEKRVILEQVKEAITSTEEESAPEIADNNQIEVAPQVGESTSKRLIPEIKHGLLNDSESFDSGSSKLHIVTEKTKNEEQAKQDDIPTILPQPSIEEVVVEQEASKEDVVNPEIPKEEVVEQETSKEQVAQPEIPEQEVVEPEIPEQDVVEPEIPKQEVVQPEVPKQDVAQSETPNEDDTKSEPNIVEPEVQNQNVQTESSATEQSAQKNEDLITTIQEAVKRTGEADSVYMTRKRTGLYPEDAKIKYSISQNRRWYADKEINVEEYIEGFPGRYPKPADSELVRYFYQTRWTKNKQTNEWENEGALYVGLGISELGFLKDIKSVEQLKISCPYPVYVVTLDKEFANKAAENLLNTPDMFKTDVTVTVMLNFEGYIISFDCDWKDDVLKDPKLGPVTITLHLGDFNQTKIQRPKDLNDEPFDYPDWRNVLTQSKKEAIKSSIYAAYDKTYKANNATYTLNGKKVEYDLQTNSALMENTDGSTTYYHGEDKYLDYDFVTPQFQQDSWTKAKDSETWNKNVRKHTCFIPKELYFLTRVFDVIDVEEGTDKTTYTIEVLKQYANSAYSYSCNTSDDKFTSNVIFTVSLDKQGYVSEIHIDSEGYKLDLVMSNINNTTVERPQGIE